MKFSCFLFKMNFGKYCPIEVLAHIMIFVCLLASINLTIIASEKKVSELPDKMQPKKYSGARVLSPASDEKKVEKILNKSQLQEWEDDEFGSDLPQPDVENKNEEKVKEVTEEREQPENYSGVRVLKHSLVGEKKVEEILNKSQLQEWEDDEFGSDLPQPDVENKNEEKVKDVMEEREQPENYSGVRVLKHSLADEKRVEKILNRLQLQEWEDDEFGPDLPQPNVENKNEEKVKDVPEEREQTVLNTVIKRINRNLQLETNATVLLYNANIPVESVEIREGNGTVRKGVPWSEKRFLWDIPINTKSGPFLLLIIADEKPYSKLYSWKIANFNLGSLELGLLEKDYSFGTKEIILIQVNEGNYIYKKLKHRGFINSKIIAPLK